MIVPLAIAVAALGAAAYCWLALVPLCLNNLPALPGFVLAGFAAAVGMVLVVIAAMAVRHVCAVWRRDGD